MSERHAAQARPRGLSLSARARKIDDEVFRIVLGLPPDVLRLTAGEPDFPTPDFVLEAANRSMFAGQTHYTNSSGIEPLKEEVAKKLRAENGLSYGADEITITPGSSAAVGLLISALTDIGDEILISDPAWFHYSVLTELAGCVPKRIPLQRESEFKITADAIEKAASEKSKLLIINTPSNPTGRVLTARELEDIAAASERLGLMVIADEIYEKIVYPPNVHRSIGAVSGMRDRCVTVNGFSKGYAMMGWRLGYCASPVEIAKKMTSLVGYTLVCAGSVAQYAAVESLKNPKSVEYAKKMVEAWTRRRAMVMKHVSENSSVVSAEAPQGTFYGWLDVSPSGLDGRTAARRMLDEAKVGVLPGYLFGNEGKNHLRISFATTDEAVDEGMSRIVSTLARAKNQKSV